MHSKFRLFNEFNLEQQPYKDIASFFRIAKNMVTNDIELEDGRVLLAKVEMEGQTALLYADRDYFELVEKRGRKLIHLFQWQVISPFSGVNETELEKWMREILTGKHHGLPRAVKRSTPNLQFRNTPEIVWDDLI